MIRDFYGLHSLGDAPSLFLVAFGVGLWYWPDFLFASRAFVWQFLPHPILGNWPDSCPIGSAQR